MPVVDLLLQEILQPTVASLIHVAGDISPVALDRQPQPIHDRVDLIRILLPNRWLSRIADHAFLKLHHLLIELGLSPLYLQRAIGHDRRDELPLTIREGCLGVLMKKLILDLIMQPIDRREDVIAVDHAQRGVVELIPRRPLDLLTAQRQIKPMLLCHGLQLSRHGVQRSSRHDSLLGHGLYSVLESPMLFFHPSSRELVRDPPGVFHWLHLPAVGMKRSQVINQRLTRGMAGVSRNLIRQVPVLAVVTPRQHRLLFIGQSIRGDLKLARRQPLIRDKPRHLFHLIDDLTPDLRKLLSPLRRHPFLFLGHAFLKPALVLSFVLGLDGFLIQVPLTFVHADGARVLEDPDLLWPGRDCAAIRNRIWLDRRIEPGFVPVPNTLDKVFNLRHDVNMAGDLRVDFLPDIADALEEFLNHAGGFFGLGRPTLDLFREPFREGAEVILMRYACVFNAYAMGIFRHTQRSVLPDSFFFTKLPAPSIADGRLHLRPNIPEPLKLNLMPELVQRRSHSQLRIKLLIQHNMAGRRGITEMCIRPVRRPNLRRDRKPKLLREIIHDLLQRRMPFRSRRVFGIAVVKEPGLLGYVAFGVIRRGS